MERAERLSPAPSTKPPSGNQPHEGILRAQSHHGKRSGMRNGYICQLTGDDVDDPCAGIGVRIDDQVEARPHPDISAPPKTEVQPPFGGMATLDHTATSNYTVLQDEADLSLKL